MSKKMVKLNIVLLLVLIAITLTSLYIGRGSDFGGTDVKGEEIISVINPTYEPWFESIIVLPSGEIESLLFSLQAAIGAGVIGYYIGLKRAKTANKEA